MSMNQQVSISIVPEQSAHHTDSTRGDLSRFPEVKENATRSNHPGYTRLFSRVTIEESFKERIRPVIILGLLYFREDDKPGFTELKQHAFDRLCHLPLFRSKLVRSSGWFKYPKWVEQTPESMDREYHIQHVPEVVSETELQKYLANLYNVDMDLTKPLWQLHYMENLQDGRSVLITVVNHAVGDGTTMVNVLQDVLMDNVTADVDADDVKISVAKRPAPRVSLRAKVGAVFGGIWRGVFGIVLPADTASVLKLKDHRHPGNKKSVAFSDTIPLERVKEIQRKFPGISINDVMLAMMTATLRAHLEDVGDPIVTQKNSLFRGNFPYDMRKNGTDVLLHAFGNILATPGFRFPLNYTNFEDLVWSIHRQIELVKVSPEPIINGTIAKALSFLPAKQMADLVLDANGKVTSMLSNVRGPSGEVKVLGSKIDDIRFLAFGPIGCYFGILSCFGKLNASVTLEETCGDANQLLSHWIPQFEMFHKFCMEHDGDFSPPSHSNE